MNSKVQPFPEWDLTVQDTIHEAMNLISGKHGFRTHFEIWRNCELIITIGHNIHTTSVEIRPPEMALIRRRANWYNSYESSRFTQIAYDMAIITSEYNTEHIEEWLRQNTPILSIENTI